MGRRAQRGVKFFVGGGNLPELTMNTGILRWFPSHRVQLPKGATITELSSEYDISFNMLYLMRKHRKRSCVLITSSFAAQDVPSLATTQLTPHHQYHSPGVFMRLPTVGLVGVGTLMRAYVPLSFHRQFEACMRNRSTFIVMPFSEVVAGEGGVHGHATMIVVNKHRKEAYHVDSNGSEGGGLSAIPEAQQKLQAELFEPYGLTFVPKQETCPRTSLQGLTNTCAYYSTFIADLMMNNPRRHPRELLDELLKRHMRTQEQRTAIIYRYARAVNAERLWARARGDVTSMEDYVDHQLQRYDGGARRSCLLRRTQTRACFRDLIGSRATVHMSGGKIAATVGDVQLLREKGTAIRLALQPPLAIHKQQSDGSWDVSKHTDHARLVLPGVTDGAITVTMAPSAASITYMTAKGEVTNAASFVSFARS